MDFLVAFSNDDFLASIYKNYLNFTLANGHAKSMESTNPIQILVQVLELDLWIPIS